MDQEIMSPSPPLPRARCVVRLKLPPAWTSEEDALLQRLAKENSFRRWSRVARSMPRRSARSCRDRWRHHLARDVYHRPFTARDDDELLRLHYRLGDRWKDIGRAVYGRTSRVMKHRWRELRRSGFPGPAAAAARKEPLAMDADAVDKEDSEQESVTPPPEKQHPFTDVLALSFASCSLVHDHAMDPVAGSLALGILSSRRADLLLQTLLSPRSSSPQAQRESDSEVEMDQEIMSPSPPLPRARCVVRLKLPPAWTSEEDALLQRLAKENSFRRWSRVARSMPRRSARSCRDRWRHHLARDVYHRPFTARDDDELLRLHYRLGDRWKDIGRAVYGRTSRVMKHRWRELRRSGFPGPAAAARKEPLAMDADAVDMEDSEQELVSPPPEKQRPFADVLASSFGSCSLAHDHAMDPVAGSLALGLSCMAV
uniref:Uncharacterized protein n=1 Tax=Oryza punctata TaxID=4537 RepID=A0A0E0LJV6_ORYPU